MDIGFDEAFRIAKKSVGDMTSDQKAEILKFDSQNDYTFRFQTCKGIYQVVVERNGSIAKISKEEREVILSSNQTKEDPRTWDKGHEKNEQKEHRYDRSREDPLMIKHQPSPGQGISQQAAVEKALSHVGGGKVEKITSTGGGYEIEINRGLIKGRMKVLVDGSGAIHAQKQSRMGEMLDFEFD